MTNSAAARPVPVLVVTGTGGMGSAIARRLAPGRTVVLADASATALARAAAELGDSAAAIHTREVDITSRTSVQELVGLATSLGPVTALAHTAGVSPTQAPVGVIWAVDLVGTALLLEEFGTAVVPGGAGLVVASMSAYWTPDQDVELDRFLGAATPEELAAWAQRDGAAHDPAGAYGLAKRANLLRVRRQSVRWAERGCRLNSISPGVIATPMGAAELGAGGGVLEQLTRRSPAGRVGTPEEIAAAAAFLLGPDSSFVWGADLLVDGGVVAAGIHPAGEGG